MTYSPPTGTVTFLFTDIEGSTRLWERSPEAMSDALARHDALMRQAIEENSGVVFKTIGDAFCAAFATAPDALNAALAAQRLLESEITEDGLSLQVRMALHTGTVEVRDSDYFGQPLNRIARLLAVGHGEQVLLSEVVADLTRDHLPPDASLKSLGRHRLRDLERLEDVYQLLYPGLRSEFPPLKSLDNAVRLTNLPQQATSFIGREKDIAEVKRLLGKTRLLTLTGSGGCGKTRLSLQAADEIMEDYADGVWLVELASINDPLLVPQAAAIALGLREEPGKPILQTLVDSLKSKQLLLVLDNCEHLLDSCARIADALLKNCPSVQTLASSRQALGIAGEQTYRIPSLSLPDDRQAQTVENVSQYEAVRLFIERALAVNPHFTVTNANAPAIAQCCAHLDGIPLAIELAAARVRSLSAEEINARLDDRFHLLTGGSRTALPRQQTLRALIDWSYDLLSDQEKTLLCRLSVFAGGWSLEAAEQVTVDSGSASTQYPTPNTPITPTPQHPTPDTRHPISRYDVLDLLTSLADKSLVIFEQEQEQTRCRLLETIRQYAADRLEESGGAREICSRHQAFFAALAEEAEPHLVGPDQAEWLHRLEREYDNLRAALEWNDNEAALRIAGTLSHFWQVRGYFTEGRERLSRLLAAGNVQPRTAARAKALRGAAVLTRSQGNFAEAQSLLKASLAVYQELGDKQGIAHTLNNLGTVAVDLSDYATARTLYEESLALQRGTGDKRGIANSLNNLGNVAYTQGDYASARALYEESLPLQRELGDRQRTAFTLNNLGNVAHDQGDFAAARILHEESLAIKRELGDRQGIATSLANLGNIAQHQGDFVSAQTLYEESQAIQRELGDRWGMAYSLVGLGTVAQSHGDYASAFAKYEDSLSILRVLGDKQRIAYALEAFASLASVQEKTQRAPRLWGAAEALREEVGAPLLPPDRARRDRQADQSRAALSEQAFSAAWLEGRAMTLERAITYALSATQRSPSVGSGG